MGEDTWRAEPSLAAKGEGRLEGRYQPCSHGRGRLEGRYQPCSHGRRTPGGQTPASKARACTHKEPVFHQTRAAIDAIHSRMQALHACTQPRPFCMHTPSPHSTVHARPNHPPFPSPPSWPLNLTS
eukprot:351579-Chlamydomonas_euryale.AAC.7